MKARGRSIAEPGLTFGVADHYVPTRGRDQAIANPEIAAMVRNLETNASESDITLFGLRRSAPGHRACGRPGTGIDAARIC